MVRPTPLTVLAMLSILQAGCSLGYNGAFIGIEDAQTVRTYSKFKQEKAAALAEAASQQALRDQEVRFDGPNKVSSLSQSEQFMPQLPTSQIEFASAAPLPRNKAFLYGQLDRSVGEGSPMDGVGALQQVTFATEGADFDPALDRTGKWLAYASTQHRPASDLYIKAVDGQTVRQLTDDPEDDGTPAFSPDGKWIVYSSKRGGNWDIYKISVDGGPSEQITNSPDDDIHPSFSPDGKRIVYCRSGSRSGQWEMVLLDLQSPATAKIIGHGLFPHWAPNDNRITYQRAREQGSRYFGIWVMELEDDEAKRPTQVAASANAAAISPRWSPDGKAIVFCTIVDPESDVQQSTPLQADIWIINADGSGRANLTQSRFANLQPVWAPDGTIYFVSNRSRNSMENIWAILAEPALRVVRVETPEVVAQTAEVLPP